MSRLLNVESAQSSSASSLTMAEIKRRIMEAGVGARDVVALVDPDDAEIRYAVVDERIPEGGYVDGYPLITGRTYLIVPLEDHPAGAERGMQSAEE